MNLYVEYLTRNKLISPKGLEIFGKYHIEDDCPQYWKVFADGKIPMKNRKKLKEIGWQLGKYIKAGEPIREVWTFSK